MTVFEHIPHVERKIFKRTFMNEISLLFTYSPLKMSEICEEIERISISMGMSVVTKGDTLLILKDKDALVTWTANAVLVSIPSSEYKDFETTGFVWDHLSVILKSIDVNPIVWSFTKGNRMVFAKAIDEEKKDEIFKIVLSDDLIENGGDKHFYVEESKDKTCVLTCRYGLEKYNGKDSLSLKTMITSQAYAIDGLKEQVFGVNELMYDSWYWCMSEDMFSLMDKK